MRGSELTRSYVDEKFHILVYDYSHEIWFVSDPSVRLSGMLRMAVKIFSHTQMVRDLFGMGRVDEVGYAQKLSLKLLNALLRHFDVQMGVSCKAVPYHTKELRVRGNTDAGVLRSRSDVCVMTWEDKAIGLKLATKHVGQAVAEVVGIAERLRDSVAFIPPQGLSIRGVLTNGCSWVFIMRTLVNGRMATIATTAIDVIVDGEVNYENVLLVTRMLANVMKSTKALLEALDRHLCRPDIADIPPPTPPLSDDGTDDDEGTRDNEDDDEETAGATSAPPTVAVVTRSSKSSLPNARCVTNTVAKETSGFGFLCARNLAAM